MSVYQGTKLALVGSTPATEDSAGFNALRYIPGECSLNEVPPLMREWDKVTEDLVCNDGGSYDLKGGNKWAPLTFKLTTRPGDAAQAIYTTLEASQTVGSFRMTLGGNAGTIYFTAEVSKFSLLDGGNKNTIHTATVELIPQCTPVYVSSTYFQGSVADTTPYIFRIDMYQPAGSLGPFTNYTVTIDLLNQSARQIVISGDDLTAAPDTITDTSSLVSLAGTGTIYCDNATTIGGTTVATGSTQNVFNGTLGDIEIVSSIADFYGDINVTLTADDSQGTTTTVIL